MSNELTVSHRTDTASPPTRPGRLRAALDLVWCRRRNGWGTLVVVVGLYALVAGWLTPRGPVTTDQALAAIGVSLVVGAACGLATRSRWAMLAAPMTFVVVFELARMRTVGPLVDGIHLGSVYGIIAFASGRFLHGVLALVPMLLGAALGAGVARHLSRGRHRPGWLRSTLRWGRRSTTVLLAVGLVALTAGIARPATTAPILGPDGRTLAGSVAELRRVEINGLPLSMMIRGDSVTNPVLLYLAGGPGGSDLGGLRRNSQNLEQAFTLVSYDQRGTGKSQDSFDPISTLTVAGAVSDAVAVTDYLRDRFHQDKIYLVGNSWGSMLGVLAAQQHPEKYAAFIGSGQMVDLRETDQIYYQDTLAWAIRTKNAGLVEQLTRNGPPPYADALKYEPVLSHEQAVYPYDDSKLAEGQAGFSQNLFHPEYSLIEQL
ncbi:MAG: alpha/beta fold hydrolase, partial [Lapillicoccus sp.]